MPSTSRLVALLFPLLLPTSSPAGETDPIPSLFIEGYTDRLSYLPGEEVVFHLSCGVSRCALEIARWGAEREVVFREEGIAVGEHAVPEDASSHGCGWPATYRLSIPGEWRSGYYQARLRVTDGGGKFIGRNRRSAESDLFFIVRALEPGATNPILLELSTNTYNAYNNWGGSSLYGYHGRAGLQGHRVSFDRPLAGQFDRWELQFVAWAEKAGYTLEYAANTDLELVPGLLDRYRLVLSVGHDEYWSAGMRDALEGFIGRGGNVAFFSGNSVCWQVRLEDEGRALVAWKQWYNQDPVYQSDDRRFLTSLWSHHLVGRPENTLTGVGFLWGGYHRSHGQLMDGSGAFTVHRPEHWAFEGTGLAREASFGAASTVVGYECDGCELRWEDGLPYPTGSDGTPAGFVVLATAPARWHPDDAEWYERWERGRDGHAVVGLYTRGGTVFTVGTTDWSHGLTGRDPAVERITRNVIERLSR